MMLEPDPQYLKNEQYKDASKLAARARLHADYNRNPQGWFQWMFELYHFPPDAHILELAQARVGCGCPTLDGFRRGGIYAVGLCQRHVG